MHCFYYPINGYIYNQTVSLITKPMNEYTRKPVGICWEDGMKSVEKQTLEPLVYFAVDIQYNPPLYFRNYHFLLHCFFTAMCYKIKDS